MSKHIWPLQPPQRLRINDSIIDLPGLNNNDVLQVEALEQVNVQIILTPARVLVYNLKPMALVASHERTAESIAEFGLNRFLKGSHTLAKSVEGLMSKKEVDDLIGYQGKIIFHVATEKNSLLTYQILKNCTNMAIFREYGIPVVNLAHLHDEVHQEYYENLDDDTLTIFEKDKSSKIIQNGYCVTKETGFLQILASSHDDSEELPLKKLELRLKVVLKFDYPVLDMISFKRLSNTADGRTEESLLLLFPHGLQQLTMIDFKLKDTSLIELIHGRKICIACNHVVVVSQNDDLSTIIYRLDISSQKHKITELRIGEKLVNCFELNSTLVLAFVNTILYYDPASNKMGRKWKIQSQIKVCGKLNDSTLLVITKAGSIRFYSQYGNLLFCSAFDDDDDEERRDNSEYPIYDYSSFLYADKVLALATHTGNYELWHLWEEAPQTFSDNRFQRGYVLQNGNNDIAIYSPPIDSSTGQGFLNTIKLPTRTINNCISLLKVNPTFKMLAIYVANKGTLLLQNMETNSWYCFKDITIIDMHWLGSTYLVCHIKQEDCTSVVQCFRFPLQELDTSEIEKYRIWSYELPSDKSLQSLHVNTAVRYRLLRVKTRDGEELDKYGEKFFRTADIVLVTSDEIMVFAVISTMHWSGLNVIKKFQEQLNVEIPLPHEVEWITNHKEGLMYLSRNKIIKISREEEHGWSSKVILRDVERILDLIGEDIFLVQNQSILIYRIEDLYESLPVLLSVPIEEDFYPVSLTPESATIHGLRCIFQPNYVRLVVKHKIYLDQIIRTKISLGTRPQDIMMEYGLLKHYNFALEKILSTSILTNEPLDGILPLIKLSDNETVSAHNDMLQIVSNCLRKIEAKHWNVLFSRLQMTPKDLLTRCLEGKDAKILGVLLLVFLNYDKADFMKDLRNEDNTVQDVIRDQDMMLSVFKLLVTSAANATDSTLAAESWDMCFQLMRLLRALDGGNNTTLGKEALEMISPPASSN